MRRAARIALDVESARVRAEALCSRAETCSGDLRKKFAAWGLEAAEGEALLARLREERFVDDERYARAYVRDKLRFNGWGRQKIARMLRQKGVDREIVEAACAGIGTEDYAGKLRKLLANKARTVKARDRRDLRARLVRFAMARGYETGQIYAALDDALAEAFPES